MPFAGIINTPPGESKLDFTFKNFSFCLNKLLDDIVHLLWRNYFSYWNCYVGLYCNYVDDRRNIRMFDYLRNAITQIILAILVI